MMMETIKLYTEQSILDDLDLHSRSQLHKKSKTSVSFFFGGGGGDLSIELDEIQYVSTTC